MRAPGWYARCLGPGRAVPSAGTNRPSPSRAPFGPSPADPRPMLKPSVQVENQDGVLVAEFWDCLRLDPNPVKDLRNHLEAHLRAGGRPEMVVDLLGVAFAGSASLGGFVALHRLVSPQGGRVVFCNVDETVFEVFRISKLSPMFTFVADRAAAFEKLRGDAPAAPPADAAPPKPPAPPAPRSAGPLRRPRRAD